MRLRPGVGVAEGCPYLPPTSNACGPIHGPSQASVSRAMVSGAASALSAWAKAENSLKADSSTPCPSAPARPRQPACAAATTRPPRCASRTGRQSATMMVHTRPGTLLTQASAHAPSALEASRGKHCAPCTCRRNTACAPGLCCSSACCRSRRLAMTDSGLSPTWSPRFKLSYGAALVPPARVVHSACTPAGAGQSGMIQSVCIRLRCPGRPRAAPAGRQAAACTRHAPPSSVAGCPGAPGNAGH